MLYRLGPLLRDVDIEAGRGKGWIRLHVVGGPNAGAGLPELLDKERVCQKGTTLTLLGGLGGSQRWPSRDRVSRRTAAAGAQAELQTCKQRRRRIVARQEKAATAGSWCNRLAAYTVDGSRRLGLILRPAAARRPPCHSSTWGRATADQGRRGDAQASVEATGAHDEQRAWAVRQACVQR
ncbi:hypothetical protein K505DRAFT_124876 [Melanomma pulvis-pyrius CBS 109.77]|uniref:Uncharacterized protein n=1 Tax=Melanomma pulvis-pyrius CBS 109.77 TaxID=1314802 RepID=A0A6A6WTN1_9PLEO|nr:hypothetical protein K505DRAFT_124876 [Melanomma pulvis-pyrius CBS 109.77]